MSEKRVMEGQQMGHTWRNRKPGAEDGAVRISTREKGATDMERSVGRWCY